MSDLKTKLDEEVTAHNQLHQAIVNGEQHLAAMKKELDQRFGRITLLQELAQDQEPESD